LWFTLEGLDVCIDILACRVVHVGVNADCLLGQGCEDLELRACESLEQGTLTILPKTQDMPRMKPKYVWVQNKICSNY
jgi:hypothetical protein